MYTKSFGSLLALAVMAACSPGATPLPAVSVLDTPGPTTTSQPTPVPTLAASPASPTSATAACKDPLDLLTYECQVSRAIAKLGFPVKLPPCDPQGLAFVTASAHPELGRLEIRYTHLTLGGGLTIAQSRPVGTVFPWDAPPGAITSVRVGEFEGEYLHGEYEFAPGSNTGRWHPNSGPQRLRWQEGEVLYEMTGGISITKADLIALAESLAAASATTEVQPCTQNIVNLEPVEALAGFDVKEPTYLPFGFRFNYADYDAESGRVRLVYHVRGGSGYDSVYASLVIFQSPITAPLDVAALSSSGTTETVHVGGAVGQYAAGETMNLVIGTYRPGAAPRTWVRYPWRALVWTENDLQLAMFVFGSNRFGSNWIAGKVDELSMITIAERMK